MGNTHQVPRTFVSLFASSLEQACVKELPPRRVNELNEKFSQREGLFKIPTHGEETYGLGSEWYERFGRSVMNTLSSNDLDDFARDLYGRNSAQQLLTVPTVASKLLCFSGYRYRRDFYTNSHTFTYRGIFGEDSPVFTKDPLFNRATDKVPPIVPPDVLAQYQTGNPTIVVKGGCDCKKIILTETPETPNSAKPKINPKPTYYRFMKYTDIVRAIDVAITAYRFPDPEQPGAFIVVFCSTGTKTTPDWFNDLIFVPTATSTKEFPNELFDEGVDHVMNTLTLTLADEKSRVHLGFHRYAQATFTYLVGPYLERLQQKGVTVSKIALLGYSLGAAVATILSQMLSDNAAKVALVTFACPTVGNKSYYAKWKLRHCVRLFNGLDPVVRVTRHVYDEMSSENCANIINLYNWNDYEDFIRKTTDYNRHHQKLFEAIENQSFEAASKIINKGLGACMKWSLHGQYLLPMKFPDGKYRRIMHTM